jgi:hypothetical protein
MDRIPCGRIVLWWAVVLTACGSGGGGDAGAVDGGPDVAVADTAQEVATDAAPVDLGPGDAPDEDAAVADAGPCTGTVVHGFCVRVPQKRQVTATDMGGGTSTIEMRDLDYVCTFAHGGTTGWFYDQANPTGDLGMAGGPQYEVVGAWFTTGGPVAPVTASYDAGGNHRNDAIEARLEAGTYRYYHSSFGSGWHKCRPPDCLQVLDGPGGAITENGCTTDRTLPIVCVPVADDGTVPPLDDPFAGGKACCSETNPDHETCLAIAVESAR